MKQLLITTTIIAIAGLVRAQNTTYGGGNAPCSLSGGYVSDYSSGGTNVLADGSVALSDNATYEHGNSLLQNNGGWTSANSLDLFLAAGNNTISGNLAPVFFNVHFNTGAGNTMAITNIQGIQIAGNLQFSNGITTTVRSSAQTGALHFAAGATYSGGTSDVQHVDGYVSKAGTTAFTFPVGSGTDSRTLSVTAPAAAAEISVAWFAGDPGTVTDPSDGSVHSVTAVASPLQSVSIAGFWDWIPVTGSDDGLTLTVSVPDLSGFGSANDLRLVGWNGTQWMDLSGSANASSNAEGSTLSGTIPAGIAITAIGIGSISTPLPVTFSAFDVKAEACTVLIEWSTAQEINNDYFLVERSTNGSTFNPLEKIASKGNSTGMQSYSVTDKHPAEGYNFYRVQQVDKDGRKSSTKVASIRMRCATDAAIQVFPTVSNNSVQVILPAGYEGATIDLLTTLGQKITVQVSGSNLNYRIDLDQLASAMYIVRIRKGTALHSYKIIKKN